MKKMIMKLLEHTAQQRLPPKCGLSVKDNFMKEMTIQLSELTFRQLEAVALKLDTSVEDLLHVSITEKLASLDKDFEAIARYIIEKNAKLYSQQKY